MKNLYNNNNKKCMSPLVEQQWDLKPRHEGALKITLEENKYQKLAVNNMKLIITECRTSKWQDWMHYNAKKITSSKNYFWD